MKEFMRRNLQFFEDYRVYLQLICIGTRLPRDLRCISNGLSGSDRQGGHWKYIQFVEKAGIQMIHLDYHNMQVECASDVGVRAMYVKKPKLDFSRTYSCLAICMKKTLHKRIQSFGLGHNSQFLYVIVRI